jgi:hypothetical protein
MYETVLCCLARPLEPPSFMEEGNLSLAITTVVVSVHFQAHIRPKLMGRIYLHLFNVTDNNTKLCIAVYLGDSI